MITVNIDLTSSLGVIRDQGRRPTCLAFAASDSHALAQALGKSHLSPEYLFYYAAQRQRPQKHTDGVSASSLFQAIQHDGQPLEAHYPYQQSLAASSALPTPSRPFRHDLYKKVFSLSTTDLINQIVVCLRRNIAPILFLEVTQAFFFIPPGANAMIDDPNGDPDQGKHAVVAVGHGQTRSGIDLIKIRNSWGSSWADNGHAWLTQTFLDRHLLSVAAPGTR